MKEIRATVLLHKDQRYPTVGDWIFKGDVLDVQVSSMRNSDYEFLVAMHEFIEAYLCYKRGIEEESVSAFDIKFEESRIEGNTDEPGNDLSAPYHKEHLFATHIEQQIAKELNINWELYDEAINEL